MIPIPEYLQNYETKMRNFSLHFDYFSHWDGHWDKKFKAKVDEHCTMANKITPHADVALKLLHRRQRGVLKPVHDRGGLYLEITAHLATPYVSGLGACHPTETGFILDRNTGLPYIPASSIKGVLRLAHALNLAERFPDKVRPCKEGFEIPDTEESMRKYFGYTDTSGKNAVRGQLVFLDAFPASVPTIKRDIMNPHFSDYYKGKTPPIEIEDPNPVMFLAVQEGVDFKFRVFASPLADGAPISNTFGEEDREAIVAMFRRAGEELGFGAKTAVGYGRMESVTDMTESLSDEWRRMAEEEENRRNPWKTEIPRIKDIDNWGDFRQKVLGNNALSDYRKVKEVADAVRAKALKLRKEWKADVRNERDSQIATWLEEAGLTWPPVETAGATAGGHHDAAAELERLKKISKWVDYIAAPADFTKLGKAGLKLIQEKLKQWGCEEKNAREDKKKELERFKEFMLQKNSKE